MTGSIGYLIGTDEKGDGLTRICTVDKAFPFGYKICFTEHKPDGVPIRHEEKKVRTYAEAWEIYHGVWGHYGYMKELKEMEPAF